MSKRHLSCFEFFYSKFGTIFPSCRFHLLTIIHLRPVNDSRKSNTNETPLDECATTETGQNKKTRRKKLGKVAGTVPVANESRRGVGEMKDRVTLQSIRNQS